MSSALLRLGLPAYLTASSPAMASADDVPEPPVIPVEVVEVHTVDDFPTVRAIYQRLARLGTPAKLVVHLGSGPYVDPVLTLLDLGGPGLVSVHLKGPPDVPALFTNGTIQIDGDHLEIEHLVFAHGRRTVSTLSLTSRGSVLLRRVSFVDNATLVGRGLRGSGGRPSPPQIRLQAGFGVVGQELRMEDVWCVGNHQSGHLPLIYVGSEGWRGSYGRVDVRGLALIGNRVGRGMVMGVGVRALDVSSVLLVEPTSDPGPASPVFDGPGAMTVRFDRVVGELPSWGAVVSPRNEPTSVRWHGSAIRTRSLGGVPAWARGLSGSESMRPRTYARLRTLALEGARVEEGWEPLAR